MATRPPRGRAIGWIVLALVVLAVLVGLWALSGPAAPPTASTAATKPSFNHARANSQLAGLQHQLMSIMSDHKDPTPLIASIRSFIKRFPPDADGWTLLGQTLAYDSQPKAAYNAVVSSLKLDSDQPSVEAMAGTLAMKLNRPDLAAIHYRQAVSLDSSKGRYRVLLASAEIQLGHYDKARMTLLGALRMDSSLYQAHAELASLDAAQDKVDQALDQINRAINMMPGNKPQEKTVYVRRRAKLLRRANRPADSLSVLQSLPLKQRYTLPVLKDMAVSWAMLGEPAKAAAHYEQARVFLPENKHLLAAAIHWHLKAHQIAQARKDLGDIRNIDPHWPKIPDLQQQIDQAAHPAASQPATRPATR